MRLKGKLFSFDLDNTLNFGDPPGPVTPRMLKQLRRKGYYIGGASGKGIKYQRQKWLVAGVRPDFILVKSRAKEWQKAKQFKAGSFIHVGDDEKDERYATRAGFRFVSARDFVKILKHRMKSSSLPTGCD